MLRDNKIQKKWIIHIYQVHDSILSLYQNNINENLLFHHISLNTK